MEIYGLVVTHIWLAFVVIIAIGYLTYADYYDNIPSYVVVSNIMSNGIFLALTCFIMFIAYTSPVVKQPIIYIYTVLCVIYSVFITLIWILFFLKSMPTIRKYFGKKRGKI